MSQSLKQKAYELIKNKIINCELLPNTPLSEKNLVEEIGGSRTPIREAINKLESEGLVKVYPKRGIFVTDVTPKNIMDIYSLLECIEPFATRLATPFIDNNKLEEFKELYLDLENDTIENQKNIDRNFHIFVANSTGNDYLQQILLNIHDQNNRARILSKIAVHERIEQVRQEHLEIIKALLERNAKKAETLMKLHVQNGKKSAMKIFT